MSDVQADPAGLTIRAAQDQVDQWIQTIGVRYFNELTNLAQLVEEVGEVARILRGLTANNLPSPANHQVTWPTNWPTSCSLRFALPISLAST